jgi:adenylate kinase family enzyme
MQERHLSGLPAWWPPLNPQRILIVGPSGSGKTTLARQLGQALSIPAIDIDELNWLPGWQQRPREELRESMATIVTQPAWVISGNYERTQDLSWPRTQLVIWLDFELSLVFVRVLKRCIIRALFKEACCNGNQESLYMTFFSKESLLLWLLQTHTKIRLRYQKRAEAESGPLVLHLRQPAEVRRFLLQIGNFQAS